MRRLIVAAVTAVLVLSPLVAIAGPAGGGGEFGTDQVASGELLGSDTAEAVAREGRDLGPTDQPRRGGGNVVCRLYDDAQPDEAVDPSKFGPEVHGKPVQLLRLCVDRDTGDYIGADLITVIPPGTVPADPRRLATMARSRLPLPLPAARMSPQGDQTVNLESWLWVENWATQSRSATAGAVTSTVVATPVEQRWTFGSPSQRKVCADAGKPYDLSRRPSEQSTTCSYTFRRSSDGQPGDVFQVTVTLVWHVTWNSNIGASGDLGFVSRTTTIPTRVAEHQALNEARSGP